MQTLAQIKAALAEYGLAPNRSLGQNFLIDQNLISKLVDESGVQETEVVLEIGPGTGTLTEELLERGCDVIACELDDGLADFLMDRLGLHTHFNLIIGDCLASKRTLNPEIISALDGRFFTLVANLPYAAATPVMLAVLTQHPECRGQYVTIQREVGERLMANPGSKAYGSISVIAQTVADVRLIATLGPPCFWPRPEVSSVMVAIERRPNAVAGKHLADCCQRLFMARRKQLGSFLGDDIPWPPGVSRTNRAEELTPSQIAALCESIHRA